MPDFSNPFALDDDEENELDEGNASNMGVEFFHSQPDEELGAGFSLAGHASIGFGGAKASGGGGGASAAPKHSSKRRTAVLRLLALIRAHGSLAPPGKATDLGTRAEEHLAKFFKVAKPQSMDALRKLVAMAEAWLKVKAKAPAAPPAPAPVVTPARRAPVMSPVLQSLRPRFVVPTVAPRSRRTVMLPAKDLRVRPEVSPIKLLLAQKRLVCHCPEEHVGDPVKKVVKLLAQEKIQRAATSEHRGRMAEDHFRSRVLRLLKQCIERKGGSVSGIRDKCRRTRVCT